MTLERRLKCRRASAQSGTRADLSLRGAKNFYVSAPRWRASRDRARGEFRRIAIATEMPEHDAREFAGQQLLDHGRGRGV